MDNIELMTKLLLSFLSSFFLSLIFNKLIIKIFRKYKLKQVEREYLESHIKKEGTPSLGGLSILLATLGSFFVYSIKAQLNKNIIAILFVFFFFALVGLYDDLAKIKNKRSDGISGKKRLFLEGLIILYMLVILNYHVVDFSESIINLFNNKIYLGALFIPFIMFLIVGCANSVNLSDGLDGLSGGLIIIAILPFLFYAYQVNDINLLILILSLLGSLLGFLMYNLHPAKIFMGDTGSLSLGATLASISVYLNKVYIIPISSLIFILETLSVIIQVLYYKKTKKRIFLMAPLHHHYEKKGIKEYRIVSYFWLYGFILCIISILIGGII